MARRARGEGTIFQRKDGRWQGEVSLGTAANGRRVRRTIYGESEAEVLDKLDALRRYIKEGVTPSRQRIETNLNDWLQHKESTVRDTTAASYRYHLEHYVTPHIGKVQLQKLTPMDVQHLQRRLIKDHGRSTAEHTRTIFGQAMKQAVRWGLIPRNPVDAVDPPRVQRREARVWAPREIAWFMAAAEGDRWHPAFYLMLSTGLRRGEVLGLRWRDVHERSIRIEQVVTSKDGHAHLGEPKSKAGRRTVPIADDVRQVLQDRRQVYVDEKAYTSDWEDHDLVFPNTRGRPMNPRNLQRVYYRLHKRAVAEQRKRLHDLIDSGDVSAEADLRRLEAGELLPRIRLHDLRHTHVSLAIKNGIDIRTLAHRIGHARTSVTLDTYAHVIERERAAGAVSLSDLLSDDDETGEP